MKQLRLLLILPAIVGILSASQASAGNNGFHGFAKAGFRAGIQTNGSRVLDDIGLVSKEKSDDIKRVLLEQKGHLKELRSDNEVENQEENRKRRISKMWESIKRRLERVIRNQRELASRMDSWIARAEAGGKNVTDIKTKLASARLLITAGENATIQSDTQIKSILSGTSTSAQMLASVKASAQVSIDSVKTAHRSMLDIMLNIRAFGVIPTPTPTPTP